MGQSLARNFANQGDRVVVFNPPVPGEEKILETFIGDYEGDFVGTRDLSVFVELLDRPRLVHLMIKSGEAVDKMINQLVPLLDEGDIIIDGGNSNYKDTQKRQKSLEKNNIHFVGMGISGGSEGALNGPSLMPGGSEKAKALVLQMYTPIAARDENPCIDWIGKDGSGHFVKMVHNGLEYADMQIITESYSLLQAMALSKDQIAAVFGEWNQSIIGSYLLEITIDILRKKENDEYLIDSLSDKAGHKGTGLWTVEAGVEYGVPIPSIQSAVDMRIMSSKEERNVFKTTFKTAKSVKSKNKSKDIDALKNAVLASRILTYAQGLELIHRASKVNGWQISIPGLVDTWRSGCIIRSNILENISEAAASVETPHFLGNNPVKRLLNESFGDLSKSVIIGLSSNVPMPVMSSSSQYLLTLSSSNLNLNIIQAQRDYFGGHGYERIDGKTGELFHTDWSQTK